MERPAYPAIYLGTDLRKYIGEQNLRFLRWADLIARMQRRNYRIVSATTTLTDGDDIVQVFTSGGSVTINLPPASSTPGKRFDIKKMEAANTVTIDAAGSDTIDGAATFAFTTQFQNMTLECVLVTAPATFSWVIV